MIATKSEGVALKAFDEHWVAELTTAAYFVALRHCATSRWLDLQLDLWRELSATLAQAGGALPARAEDFLAELAYSAYRIALSYGRRQSFLDLELELYQTFRRIMECAEITCAAPIVRGASA